MSQENPDAQNNPATEVDAQPDHLDWHRVHPATPFLDVGLGLIALVVAFVSFSFNQIQDAIELFTLAREHGVLDFIVQNLVWLLGGVLVLVGIVALNWWSWRVRAYAIDHNAVYSRWGILNKQLRKARLDRVQSIDIRQRFMPRIFGMAELTFDVAGGEGSEVTIKFLTKKQAEDLREDMLAQVRAAKSEKAAPVESPAEVAPTGLAPEDTPAHSPHTEAPGTTSADHAKAHRRGAPAGSRITTSLSTGISTVAEDLTETVDSVLMPYRIKSNVSDDGRLLMVPAHRVILSRLVSTPSLILVMATLVVLASIAVIAFLPETSFSFGGLAGLFGLVAAVGAIVKQGLAESNFAVSITGDGLAMTSGLLDTRRSVIPLDRIQAVELNQSLLWRPFGWWRATFNLAGTSETGKESVLLPVGTLDEVMVLLGLVLPDPGVPEDIHGGDLIREAALKKSKGEPVGPAARMFTHQPASSKWVDPISWKSNVFAFTDTMLVVRRGVLNRTVQLVPHARVQSLALEEGPLQSALGLKSISIHSTSGPVHPHIYHFDGAYGHALLNDYAERTVRARRVLDGVEA
ncbi:PH domain-containing protein [uncultured Brevibacterium sp.]|uniref:PH domain-containing protein n=1 Tax=uncultured Brevibacterium sp. TaxID=189678 RepID=UPI0025D67BC3|nr:PH domain-containing protein [uncultured Brevibacterium sp.]